MYRQFIEDNYDKMSEILNCLKIGVYITDGEGNTLLLNDESCKTGGLTREETVGKNMRQLETQGFIEESVSLEVMKSGKEEAMIQNLGDGDKVYVTGVPLFEKDDIDIIINTERNITETLTLKKLLEKNSKVTAKIREEIEYLRKQSSTALGNMVAEDEETKRLAEKAARVAKLDTTVLLTGESGTGKEVFANFIYSNSGRVGRPFIKVNCAAIPENLMESELFGYVGGAFSGADKNGKMGLFEIANHGTLFLDEVGGDPDTSSVQASEGYTGEGDNAGWRYEDYTGEYQVYRRYQPRLEGIGGQRRFQRGFVLQAQRDAYRAAAVKRPEKGYQSAGSPFCQQIQ